jgi:glycosyltransferase involved in cell wall biosynthesis
MKEYKKVSVVLCTYNGEKYLKEQIDSILTQTYPIHELIIQDDCSTDNTVSIIHTYMAHDDRVKLYINSIPLGFNYNFSSAFSKATGEYIASSDQDDIWEENKIERLLLNIGDHRMAFHNSMLFTDTPSNKLGVKNPANSVVNELYFLLKPYIPGHECFFHRDLLPLYNEVVLREKNVSYDSLITLVAEVAGGVTFVNENLVLWRRHSKATSYKSGKTYSSNLSGLLLAVKALSNSERRKTTQHYFQAVSCLPFKQKCTQEIVRLMSKGTLKGIIQSCYISQKNYALLFPSVSPKRARIKAFFTPLYFLRDSSIFIIK